MSSSRAHDLRVPPLTLALTLVVLALPFAPSALTAQNRSHAVVELRDGGFARGRVIERSLRGGVELLRVDGVRMRYAGDEVARVVAPEPRVLVPVTGDRPGLSLELTDGVETPSVAARTTGAGGQSDTQLVFLPPIARSDRQRLCLLPCTLSLTPGTYVFALSADGFNAAPPLPPVSISAGDELRAHYVDRQPQRTAGLVLVLTSMASILGSGAMLLGPFYGLDVDLSFGLAVGFALAAVTQAIIGFVLLRVEDVGRIEVRSRRHAASI